MKRPVVATSALLLSMSALAPALFAQPIAATVVLQEGDIPAGTGGIAVTTMDNPYTNGNGQMCTIFQLANGNHGLWFNGAVAWLGSQAVGSTLTTPQAFNRQSCGVSDSGTSWVYQPERNGLHDALWTHNGLLITEKDPAPGRCM